MTAIVRIHERPPARLSERYVAASPQMIELMNKVERVAGLPWPVLITGETGSGKEGVARALHQSSPRARCPFVVVDAGALPESLVTSELFGHERGAFTGAIGTHQGVFESAHTGTLFLDEVGELSLTTQAKLLRVVETSEVRRVGSSQMRRVDVRVVCATNRNLREMVAAGTFRADLYHRLACVVLEVPPLRERPEDAVELVEHFVELISAELGRVTLTEGARIRLAAHPFHGNVRELRNLLFAAAVNSASRFIDVTDVETAFAAVSSAPITFAPTSLRQAMEMAKGNITTAAKALGIPRTTLRDRLLAEARRQ